MSLEVEKSYLKKENIYDHLGAIINKVISEKPKDAHGLVEVLSRLIKEPTSQSATPDPEAVSAQLQAQADYVQRAKALDAVPQDESGPVAVCAIPDQMEFSEMLSWAGVGFSELECYKILCSLRNLAFKEKEAGVGLQKLRFWGKVLGTEADYFVAEAQREGGGGEEEGADPDAEPAGTGANAYTFYVTTDLCEPWKRLPDIKPKEIIAARKIKRLMTGNLDANVVTHPAFPGTEQVLLRAQIARITSDTVLCVGGFLKREGEEPEFTIEENPEFEFPLPSKLFQKEAWTHMNAHILPNGRTTYQEVPEEDEENPEVNQKRAKLLAEIEAFPVRNVIRVLDGDGLEWVIKQVGDTALYRMPPGPEGVARPPRSIAVTFVRSLSWPGAVCATQNGHFENIYIGDALPADGTDFFFAAPPDVQDEPEDPKEQPEPQGSAEQAAPAEEE